MTQIIGTITDVRSREVNKRDGTTFTLQEVFDDEGTAWVARQDVANIARGFIGQRVEMVCRTEQNGKYTNRYIDSVLPLNGSAPTVAAAVAAAQQTMQAQQEAQVRREVANPPYVFDDKDRSIFRQVAAKVSAEISDNEAEFWQNCKDLTLYFETGVAAEGIRKAEAVLTGTVGVEPQPQQVYDNPDDDIPF